MQDLKHNAWTKRVVAAASAACGMLVAGCGTASPGKCDMTQLGGSDMAMTVNTGQTVVNSHCASGRCHSELATGKQRYGVPAGFNFDAVVTDSTPQTLALVMHGISTIKENADWMWGQVDSGNMPPPKQGSLTATEKDQMRNWLACGAPAVLAPQGVITAPTTDWTTIYTGLTSSTCFSCHSTATMAAGMNFSLGDQGDQCAAYAAIVNKPSVTPTCMGKGLILVKPGDPANSFMLQKMGVGTLACGMTMPFGSPMPLNATNPTLVSSFQQWIMAGAPKPAACP